MKRITDKYPGLYREQPKGKSSRYRILINHNKKQYQESFIFYTPLQETRAKRAAIKRWKELRKLYPVLTKRAFRELPRRTSESGLTGIRRIKKVVNEREYEFWTASWTDLHGKRTVRSFSINKHGEKEAKKLAVKARKEGLKAIPVKKTKMKS